MIHKYRYSPKFQGLVYFVAETKSSTVEADRRRDENLKIDCGIAHFKLAQGVEYKVATTLQALAAP